MSGSHFGCEALCPFIYSLSKATESWITNKQAPSFLHKILHHSLRHNFSLLSLTSNQRLLLTTLYDNHLINQMWAHIQVNPRVTVWYLSNTAVKLSHHTYSKLMAKRLTTLLLKFCTHRKLFNAFQGLSLNTNLLSFYYEKHIMEEGFNVPRYSSSCFSPGIHNLPSTGSLPWCLVKEPLFSCDPRCRDHPDPNKHCL